MICISDDENKYRDRLAMMGDRLCSLLESTLDHLAEPCLGFFKLPVHQLQSSQTSL